LARNQESASRNDPGCISPTRCPRSCCGAVFVFATVQRNTESRVALFSVIESCVLAAVTILQVLYIRRLVNSSVQLPGTPGMLGKSGRVYR
jgi:hypothetical protein